MKPKFNLLATFLLFASFIANAVNIDAVKEYHESWPANSVQTMQIINKYGEVRVNNNGGSEVTVDVIVTVEASSESRANKMLQFIDIDFSKSGNKVKAETSIDNDFKSRKNFTIDYTVNIPTDKNLIIENKFGNVVVNELNARGNFIVKYGLFSAYKLNGVNPEDINITLEYGKATIETISSAIITVKYSKIFMGKANDLELTSKYSVLNIEELNSITLDSRYDTFNFEKAGSVEGGTKYSNFKIDELKKAIKIENGYGSIKVGEVASDFELISINNSYGGITLGMGSQASYDVDVNCEYCSISYDADRFSGNKKSENHTKSIKGKMGSGEPSGKVVINSRYGGVKLYD